MRQTPYRDVLVPQFLDPLTVPFQRTTTSVSSQLCLFRVRAMAVRLTLSTLQNTRLSSTNLALSVSQQPVLPWHALGLPWGAFLFPQREGDVASLRGTKIQHMYWHWGWWCTVTVGHSNSHDRRSPGEMHFLPVGSLKIPDNGSHGRPPEATLHSLSSVSQ